MKKEYTEEEVRLIIEGAIQEERAACAEVCDLMYDYGWLDAKRCAREIRARGQG